MNILLDPLVVAPGADPASVPTLSTWAMLLLMTGLAVLAGPGLARKRGGAPIGTGFQKIIRQTCSCFLKCANNASY